MAKPNERDELENYYESNLSYLFFFMYSKLNFIIIIYYFILRMLIKKNNMFIIFAYRRYIFFFRGKTYYNINVSLFIGKVII